MGEIQFSGLSTGIDTAAIVEQLMAIESQRLKKYEADLSEREEVRSVLNELETKLDALQGAVEDLSDSDTLRSYETTSSDSDILTAEASDKAFEGNHTLVIDQLANAERWVHSTGVEYAEDYVGAGNFIYSYDGKETVLTTSADTTLEDLVGLINNDADNPGITASLLFYNDAYHMVLNGNDAGSDYSISINDSNTEVWQADTGFTSGTDDAGLDTLLTDLDQLTGTLVGDESITITGTQHDGTAVNASFAFTDKMKLSHLINEIEDAFGGTAKATLEDGKVVLTDTTNGTSLMTLNLTYNAGSGSTTFTMPTVSQSTAGGSVTASLAGFSGADFLETQSAQDSRLKVDGFPAGADEWITRSSNTIDDVISGVTLHLHDTGTIQVGLTRDIESLKEKVTAMVDAYNLVVSFIDENTSYDEESGDAGLLMTDSTVRGLKSLLRTPLIEQTSGFLKDIDTFLLPGEIGLELDGDGLLNLDTSVFEEAVTESYMGLLALIGADKTGSSSSDTIDFFAASSKYTASGTYEVEVTVSGGVITSARIKSEDESTYRDATISGNMVVGDSTFSDGDALYPENGLQLSVDLSQDGTFTSTVRVKQGFAGAMEDIVDRLLKPSNGVLTMDQDSVDRQIDNLEEDIDDEEDRLSRREERLMLQYARLESTLTLLQSQMSALSALSTSS